MKINKYYDISKEQETKYNNYMNLLIEWNNKINLTSIIDENEIILKHFLDSISISKYINDNSKIIDIGTGAGFPGIPLKIYNNSYNLTLLDSLNKRILFLNNVIGMLKLDNVETIHGRAEEIAQNRQYREKYDVAVSRAVSKLNILVEYMIPFLKINGKCICMKGPNSEEEIKEAENAIKILGGKIIKIDKFKLPDSDIQRTIIIIKKIRQTDKKYPRKAGIPSKQPL